MFMIGLNKIKSNAKSLRLKRLCLANSKLKNQKNSPKISQFAVNQKLFFSQKKSLRNIRSIWLRKKRCNKLLLTSLKDQSCSRESQYQKLTLIRFQYRKNSKFT